MPKIHPTYDIGLREGTVNPYHISELCQPLQVSKSGYYAVCGRMPGPARRLLSRTSEMVKNTVMFQ